MNNSLRSIRDFASHNYARAGAALTIGMLSLPAFAGPMADGFTAEAEEGKADLWLIGGVVLGVCAISFLIGRGKKTAS